MYSLPTFVTINGKDHPITNNGDYRVIIEGCFKSLNDPELDKQFRVICALICFYEELNCIEDVDTVFGDDVEEAVIQMYNFFNCGQDTVGAQTERELIDWEKDSQLICSAVNSVAPVNDIRDPNNYIHWFTFMGYYISVGECPWAHIVSIREKIVKHKKLEKHERKFKEENPEYFVWGENNMQQSEAMQLVSELWNAE